MDRNRFFDKIWEAYEAGDFIAACAWCGRLQVEEEWVDPQHGALSTIDAVLTLSHSICPSCLEAQLPPKSRTARGEQPARG
jgi:hypothetical protein